MPDNQEQPLRPLDSSYLVDSLQIFEVAATNLTGTSSPEDVERAVELLRDASDRFKGELAIRGQTHLIPVAEKHLVGGKTLFQTGNPNLRIMHG